MISNLSAQLSHLIKAESQTIIGYAPENIIVLNGNTFAFLDSELVAEIDPVGKEMATISCPFKVTDFFASPEILKITELPSYVHYKTSYFSLGCLLLYALTEGRLEGEDFYKEYLKELKCEKIHEYLTGLNFKNTKLYWLLSRCLVEEPKKRSILFI
jgi:serine/threonine protein kinase